MLGDAIQYPRTGDDWLPTILIGGACVLFSWLILPYFILQGYLVRTMHDVATGETTAPSFTDWGKLLVDGLKLFAVSLAYGFLILIVAGGLTLIGELVGGVVGFLFVVLGLLAVVAVLYVFAGAIVRFAVEERLGAAFEFGELKTIVTRGEYAVGVLLGIVIAMIGSVVGGMLSIILVGFIVVFYAQVVTFYCFARGYADAGGVSGDAL